MHSVHRAQMALGRLEALSTPPETILRLLEVTLSKHPSIEELVALIRTDPGLSLEVLRRMPPESLKRRNSLHIPNALHAVGVDGLRELALRSELRGSLHFFDADDGAVCSLTARKHAVASASVAYDIAVALEHPEPEVAYAAGLLTSLGSLAMWDLFEEHMSELSARSVGQDLARVIEFERQGLGVDHESLAVVMAESWNLPAALSDVVSAIYRTTEQLERLAQTGADAQLASLARAGLYLAHAAGFPRFSGVRLPEPPSDVTALLSRLDVDRLITRARSAVGRAAELSRPLARNASRGLEDLQRAHGALRERLLRTERLLRAEEAVNKVLKYGLNRLGDGDPLPGVMFRAMESMGFHRISCLEIDTAASKLEVVRSSATTGHSKVNEGAWLPFPADSAGLIEPAILNCDDASPAHQLVLELIGVSTAVVAPLRELKAGKRLVLAADRDRAGRAPSPGEERCLDIIAEQLSLLLQFEELSNEKERMATLDPLTGAATRRRLMDRLEYSITQSARTKLPLALLMMDLDHFKKFNDTMGHQVGDRLLQDLVKVLSKGVRKGDLVARYGGEEFVVVLPNCAMEHALSVAEDLRNEVYDYGLAQRESYRGLAVSVSIGAAEWVAGETALELIGRADAALYASKHGGRNRVTAAA